MFQLGKESIYALASQIDVRSRLADKGWTYSIPTEDKTSRTKKETSFLGMAKTLLAHMIQTTERERQIYSLKVNVVLLLRMAELWDRPLGRSIASDSLPAVHRATLWSWTNAHPPHHLLHRLLNNKFRNSDQHLNTKRCKIHFTIPSESYGC